LHESNYGGLPCKPAIGTMAAGTLTNDTETKIVARQVVGKERDRNSDSGADAIKETTLIR
jgi:hypothetical protein